MDTKVNYALVGGFVITLFACIVLSIIWLSSGLSITHYIVYQVNMSEAVSGLSIDSAVEFNGVNVGAVKSIQIDKDNLHLVELLLNIRKDTPISQGTVATLEVRGLTGITFISLKDVGKDMKPLTVSDGNQYPIIKTAPSFYMQLNTALTRLSESGRQLSDSVHALLDEGNLRSIKEILANVSQISATLAGSSAQLNTIINNTSAASQQLPSVMQAFELQILPDTNRLLTKLNNMTDNLSQVSADLQQNPAVLIRGKSPQPLGPGEK